MAAAPLSYAPAQVPGLAPYSAPVNPLTFAQNMLPNPMGGYAYPGFPTATSAIQQATAAQTPAYSAEGEPAGYMELAQHYGSLERAAYESNLTAMQNYRDAARLEQVASVLQFALAQSWAPLGLWMERMGVQGTTPEQIPALLDKALTEHAAMYELLHDVDALADYFTQLNDARLQAQGLPPMSQNMEFYRQQLAQAAQQQGQQGQPQQGQQQQPSAPAGVSEQEWTAWLAQQQAQQQQAQQQQMQQQPGVQRPTMPGGFSAPGSASWQDFQSTPEAMRWKVLDQMGIDGWRNTRVVF